MKVTFAKPDLANQILARLVCSIDVNLPNQYLDLEIDGNPTTTYQFAYSTNSAAWGQSGCMIYGKMSNVSLDWTKPILETDYVIIQVIGTVDKGIATLTLWIQR